MLAGGDFFCDLDTMRADVAGAQLRAVADPPASTTALGLARRFGPEQTAGLRAAQVELVDRHVAALPSQRRRELLAVRPTIDLDPTDVEVYGTAKGADRLDLFGGAGRAAGAAGVGRGRAGAHRDAAGR